MLKAESLAESDGFIPGFLYMWLVIWNALLVEVLLTKDELAIHNVAAIIGHAVVVNKHPGETVGHLPRKEDYVAYI